MTALILALAIVAAVLAVVELARGHLTNLLAWGLLALAAAFALPYLAAL